MRIYVVALWVVGAVALPACGGASLSGIAEPPEEDVGGDTDQVAYAGVFPEGNREVLTGELELDTGGCWWIEIGGVRYLAAFPEGSVRGEGGVDITTPAGYRAVDGATVDTLASVVHFDEVPDIPDGAWGGLVAFCQPEQTQIVVMRTVDAAFDPATVPAERWAAAASEADLSVDHACGFGFAASATDQQVALVAYWSSTEDDGGETRSVVTFPDPAWQARLLVGKNLLAGSCDDVFEPWEPVPVIAGDWALSGGTLTFMDVTLPVPCGSPPVTARLVGATATSPAGEVRLPDLELVNTGYGCFAG